jgi:hypothetical protein
MVDSFQFTRSARLILAHRICADLFRFSKHQPSSGLDFQVMILRARGDSDGKEAAIGCIHPPARLARLSLLRAPAWPDRLSGAIYPKREVCVRWLMRDIRLLRCGRLNR